MSQEKFRTEGLYVDLEGIVIAIARAMVEADRRQLAELCDAMRCVLEVMMLERNKQ